jgi:hypothetical protein
VRGFAFAGTALEVVIPRASGVSSTPQPFDSITDASGILDRPPSRAMTSESVARSCSMKRFGSNFMVRKHSFAISPRISREFCRKRPTLNSEGAGNAGRSVRPQPRMQCENKHTSIVTTVTPEIARHSPRNGFNGFLRALPGVRILGCHRHRRIKVCQTRSGRLASADLAPATGARTTRLCRPHWRRSSARASSAHRPMRACPAIPARARRCRVHRIPPRVRDDREPPLCGTGRRGI